MDVWLSIRRAVAAALPDVQAERVRIIARGADCGAYAPKAGNVCPEAFGRVLGVPLVREIRMQSGWALLSLTDAFYSACVADVQATLPLPAHDGGCYALNRMLALARQGGVGCPAEAQVQQALLRLLGAAYGHTSLREAERMWLLMLHGIAPDRRQGVRAECGALGDASARLYAYGAAHLTVEQYTI